MLKKTFYAQFCAGETREEVGRTVDALKRRGFTGVILGYAREIVMQHDQADHAPEAVPKKEGEVDADIEIWKKGTLDTVEMTQKGDFVALKFTGAGSRAIRLLSKALPPDAALEKATVEICNLAKARGVRLLFDAEQQAVQGGLDAWTLDFQKRYNSTTSGKAVVYGTYQAYLRSTPAALARDLAAASAGQFTLGVKLVRGAYLGCDPRHLFWSTKEDTDRVYDGIAESLMRTKYGDVLIPLHGEGNEKFPDVNLVLASHNHTTVRKAMAVQKEQLESGKKRIDMVYGQLMGMADEVSCELVQAGKDVQGLGGYGEGKVDVPKAYKYLVWGTVGECVKYLLRRAEENRDAVVRTKEGLAALRTELVRRLGL
ncbi:MAG: proline oxidase [Lasallia pustulata]|uniref:Proline dehydrogenase n=1 Tax=Lasallia pustulata TaxID=136370 RepID=A0A5M8Q3S2_9LECA|nr:MAG: proline oxidase [Lasallia pustulata]